MKDDGRHPGLKKLTLPEAIQIAEKELADLPRNGGPFFRETCLLPKEVIKMLIAAAKPIMDGEEMEHVGVHPIGYGICRRDLGGGESERVLMLPIQEHCDAEDRDHGWVVSVQNQSTSLKIEVEARLRGTVMVSKDMILDWQAGGKNAAEHMGQVVASRVMWDVLDEVVPCHFPEVQAKTEAAIKDIIAAS